MSSGNNLLVSRQPCVPLWQFDSKQRTVSFEKKDAAAQSFWRHLAPLFDACLRKTRRVAFAFPRFLFGEMADLLIGEESGREDLVFVQCKAIPFELRPCEWSVFVAAMIVSTLERTSFVLLTALEIETLQVSKPEVFGISRLGVHSDELFTPAQCFAEIWALNGLLKENLAGRGSDSLALVMLVDELRRIRCFDFANCRPPAEPLLLQYLHIVILATGLAGVAVLERAHRRFQTRDELFRFYENFHWVVRSHRFLSFFRLSMPTKAILTPALDNWVCSLQRKIDLGVNGCSFDQKFAFDGRLDGVCSLSIRDLIEKLGSDAAVKGRAAVVHSYLQGNQPFWCCVFCFTFFLIVFLKRRFGDAIGGRGNDYSFRYID